MTLEVKESNRTIGTLVDVEDRPGDMGGGILRARWPDCPFAKITEQKYAWTLEAPGLEHLLAWLNVIEAEGDGGGVESGYGEKGGKRAGPAPAAR